MLIEPNCNKRDCKHFLGAIRLVKSDETTERVACEAFPALIPAVIAYGDNLHLSPFPGDRGIQYERRSQK